MKEEPTTTVEFHLYRSLPDNRPTIVKREGNFQVAYVSDPIPEELSASSDLNEIMWNFSRCKDERRLTLKDNPHFYKTFPTSAEHYGGRFRAIPVEAFLHNRISVLTDNPRLTGRVFLETAKLKRVFGNVWVPGKAIIFKGSYLSVFLFLIP